MPLSKTNDSLKSLPGADAQTRAVHVARRRPRLPITRYNDISNQTKIYLAGPMRGYPEFNFPAFYAAAKKLRKQGFFVFSPAECDNERYGTCIGIGNLTGNVAQAEKDHGFSLREALAADMKFICEQADAIFMLPGWEKSKGARAEQATADALGLRIIEAEKL